MSNHRMVVGIGLAIALAGSLSGCAGRARVSTGVDVRGARRELLGNGEDVHLSGAAAGAKRRADLPDAGGRARSHVGRISHRRSDQVAPAEATRPRRRRIRAGIGGPRPRDRRGTLDGGGVEEGQHVGGTTCKVQAMAGPNCRGSAGRIHLDGATNEQ